MTDEGFLLPNAPILDTNVIARRLKKIEPVNSRENTSLGGLLQYFQISHHKSIMHDGGNDSNLTMRALLMQAVRSLQGYELSEHDENTCRKLEAIARSPLVSHERFEKTLFSRATEYGDPLWVSEALPDLRVCLSRDRKELKRRAKWPDRLQLSPLEQDAEKGILDSDVQVSELPPPMLELSH